MVSPSHLTDVVAAGGSDGLVDHLLTHNAVECLLDTTQQTSLREGNNANKYTTLQYSVPYTNIVVQYQEYTEGIYLMMTNKAKSFVFSQKVLILKYIF